MRAYCLVPVGLGERPAEVANDLLGVDGWNGFRFLGADTRREAGSVAADLPVGPAWTLQAIRVTLDALGESQVWRNDSEDRIVIRNEQVGIHAGFTPSYAIISEVNGVPEEVEVTGAILRSFAALGAALVVDDSSFSYGFDLAVLDDIDRCLPLFDHNPGWFSHPGLGDRRRNEC